MNINDHKRFSGVLGDDYDLFKKAVPHHDEFQDKIFEILKNFANKLLDKKEVLIFEAGTGTGISTIRILKSDGRIRILAVDNEGKTLNQAKQVLVDFKNRITYKNLDLLKALKELPDSCMDGFVSAYTIHNLPTKYREKLFPEIKRVLKPGGIFVNADKYAQVDQTEYEISFKQQIKDFDIYEKMGRSDLKESWVQHYLEDDEMKIVDADQIEILNNLGFKNVKIVYRNRMEAIILGFK